MKNKETHTLASGMSVKQSAMGGLWIVVDRFGREILRTKVEADARLIVAAPDLLDLSKRHELEIALALKPGSPNTFMDLVAVLSRQGKELRAAILKAEGK